MFLVYSHTSFSGQMLVQLRYSCEARLEHLQKESVLGPPSTKILKPCESPKAYIKTKCVAPCLQTPAIQCQHFETLTRCCCLLRLDSPIEQLQIYESSFPFVSFVLLDVSTLWLQNSWPFLRLTACVIALPAYFSARSSLDSRWVKIDN
jgi:hypothetical protein